MEIIITIISLILGCSSLLSYILFRRQSKQLKNLEVKSAGANVIELYEKRIESLHQTIEICNNSIRENQSTIADNNANILDKVSQIRSLTESLIKSEQEQNELNLKIQKLIEENGKLKLKNQNLNCWKCIKGSCDEREPESPSIKGKKYEE